MQTAKYVNRVLKANSYHQREMQRDFGGPQPSYGNDHSAYECPDLPLECSSSRLRRVKPDHNKYIPNGTYRIVNVHTGTYAGLLNNNDRSDVVSLSLNLDPDVSVGTTVGSSLVPCQKPSNLTLRQWSITHLQKDEYKLQSVGFKSYASYDPMPSGGDMVLAKRKGVKEWIIRVVARPNIYTLVICSLIRVKPTDVHSISPTANPDIFWKSPEGGHGTPVSRKTSRRLLFDMFLVGIW